MNDRNSDGWVALIIILSILLVLGSGFGGGDSTGCYTSVGHEEVEVPCE